MIQRIIEVHWIPIVSERRNLRVSAHHLNAHFDQVQWYNP